MYKYIVITLHTLFVLITVILLLPHFYHVIINSRTTLTSTEHMLYHSLFTEHIVMEQTWGYGIDTDSRVDIVDKLKYDRLNKLRFDTRYSMEEVPKWYITANVFFLSQSICFL